MEGRKEESKLVGGSAGNIGAGTGGGGGGGGVVVNGTGKGDVGAGALGGGAGGAMQFIFSYGGRTLEADQSQEEAGMEDGDEILAVEMMDLTEGPGVEDLVRLVLACLENLLHTEQGELMTLCV